MSLTCLVSTYVGIVIRVFIFEMSGSNMTSVGNNEVSSVKHAQIKESHQTRLQQQWQEQKDPNVLYKK